MELYDRIREIRKSLNYNQGEFAEQLGVAQSTIAMMEVGKREIQDRHIKTICALFDVNEEWLRTGNGEMHNAESEDFTQQLAEKYKLTQTAVYILETYLEMTPEGKEIFDTFLKSLFKKIQNADGSENYEYIPQAARDGFSVGLHPISKDEKEKLTDPDNEFKGDI